MRILMLTTENSLADGINRHIVEISNGLSKIGVEVAVCTTHTGGDFARKLAEAGIRTYALGCGNGHDIRLLWRFRHVMREFKPDIVHIHVMALMERLYLSWFYRGNVRFFCTIHGISDPVLHITMRMRLERLLTKLSPLGHIEKIYISKGVRKYLHGNGPVVYNPMNAIGTAPSDKLHKMLALPLKTRIVGTACRFADPQKKTVSFVRVLCFVLEGLPDAHAVLIGDGDEATKQRMREEEAKHDVGGRLHWLGYRSDAAALIGELSMFVMTSKWEGMPTALLEAMSQKTPIAFLNGGGGLVDLAELNKEEGPLAEVADTERDLADAIIASLKDENATRIKVDNAYNAIIRHFEIGIVARELHRCYTSDVSKM